MGSQRCEGGILIFIEILHYMVYCCHNIILIMRHALNLAELDSKKFLEIKENINIFDLKLFETIAKLCLSN